LLGTSRKEGGKFLTEFAKSIMPLQIDAKGGRGTLPAEEKGKGAVIAECVGLKKGPLVS